MLIEYWLTFYTDRFDILDLSRTEIYGGRQHVRVHIYLHFLLIATHIAVIKKTQFMTFSKFFEDSKLDYDVGNESTRADLYSCVPEHKFI